MKRLFDYECAYCGNEFEEFFEPSVECPHCGYSPCTKLITGTRIDPKLGVDPGSFTTLGDKWARVREQKQKIEAKRAREHGDS